MSAATGEAQKLSQKVATDAASATSVALAKVGLQLGLYDAMATIDEFQPAELAERTGTLECYVRDWLINQTAAGYVSYNKDSGKFYLSQVQKDVFTNASSPHYAASQMIIVSGFLESALKESPTEMRHGHGVSFSAHDPYYIENIARFSISLMKSALIQKWIPECTLPEHQKQLEKGEETLVIADVGCGFGNALRLMAQTFSKKHIFVGFDYDDRSIEECKKAAASESLTNCLFEKCDAHNVPAPNGVEGFENLWKSKTEKPCAQHYDIVFCMNAVHDLQDPLAAIISVRKHLNPDSGVYIVTEPFVNEPLEKNFNPKGQFFSAASLTWCTPGGRIPRPDGAEKISTNLGVYVPDSRYEELGKQAGFSRFKKIPSETNRIFVYQV